MAPNGGGYLRSSPSAATQLEIRETYPELLTVASIVVAALALGGSGLGYESTRLLVASFAALSVAWMLSWSLAERFSRLLADGLLWVGISLLLSAVQRIASPDPWAQATVLPAIAVAVLGSWRQGRTYYNGYRDAVGGVT